MDALCPRDLVFAIAGPIGIDVDAIADSLSTTLGGVGYSSYIIKLTNAMKAISLPNPVKRTGEDYFSDMSFKMDYANAICKTLDDDSALARIAIHEIQKRRAMIVGDKKTTPTKIAYIIRQLKRPSEVQLLRKVYGRQFVLISAYGSLEDRSSGISVKLRRSLSTRTSESEIAEKSQRLISRDADEDQNNYGQQLRETFHLADVFIDGMSKQGTLSGLHRFIFALFGKADIAPTKYEYGMYAAKSASLRSSDLSRQVGSAILSDDGDIIASGCNEVPRAFGGTYWDTEIPDFRDVKLSFDPNERLKKELLRDLFERMKDAGLLSKKALNVGNPEKMVEVFTQKSKSDTTKNGPLVGADVMDLTEYGRVVHAEMCSICDAARLGRSIKQATMFVTTFPCHNCTKHIIASGIKRVVYMEPYPKSKAKELHDHEITIETEVEGRVAFVPFLGISPYRYRDIFQKGRRKRRDGTAEDWYGGTARPLIDVVAPSYTDIEPLEIAPLFARFTPEK